MLLFLVAEELFYLTMLLEKEKEDVPFRERVQPEAGSYLS